MDVKFALNITDKATIFKNIFYEVEKYINSIIQTKDYGSDLIEIFVGWICVAPDYDDFFKPRKTKYYSYKEIVVGGQKTMLHKALEYEIKLNYHTILESNEEDVRKIIMQKFLHNLIFAIEENKKKIRDFNIHSLVDDLKDNW